MEEYIVVVITTSGKEYPVSFEDREEALDFRDEIRSAKESPYSTEIYLEDMFDRFDDVEEDVEDEDTLKEDLEEEDYPGKSELILFSDQIEGVRTLFEVTNER